MVYHVNVVVVVVVVAAVVVVDDDVAFVVGLENVYQPDIRLAALILAICISLHDFLDTLKIKCS